MFIYITVFLTTLALFASLFVSVHNLFSKLIAYWILPTIISSVLLAANLPILVETLSQTPPDDTLKLVLFLTLSLSWYFLLVVYRALLKKTLISYTYEYDAAKVRNEAKYINKLELRRYKKRSKKEERIRKKEVKKKNESSLVHHKNDDNWDKLYD